MASSMYLYSLFVLAMLGLATASHGRYGSINFQKNPSNPKLVTITANVGWRRSAWYPNNVGDIINDNYLYFGDGQAISMTSRITSVNVNDDWMTVSWTGTHQYANAGTYVIYITNCCRISNLMNNHDQSFQYFANLKITAAEISSGVVNSSPVANMLPIITVPYGVSNYQYQVLAIDPEGDTMSYALSTAAQMGDGAAVQPSGIAINSVTGVVTLRSNLAMGYWNTQQTVTDAFGNLIVIDYLLSVEQPRKFCNGTCNSNNAAVCTSNADCVACNSQCLTSLPRVVTNSLSSSSDPATSLPAPPNGASINLFAGQPQTLSFVVDDANLFNPTNAPYIYTASVPSYATVGTQKDCTPANGCTYRGTFQKPQLLQITLNPTAANVGTTVVCIGATSLGNPLPYAQHCVSLDVSAQTCGNGVVEGTEVCDGGSCCSANCMSVKSSGSVCRAAAGPCDVAETCDGSSTTCPADSVSASTTTCRASNGPCDVAETCDGSSVSCPSDSVAAATTTCRASAGPCDVAETCDGSSYSCPADAVASTATTCRASAGSCDVAETCDGSSTTCPADSVSASGSVCRSAAGVCDVAETCDGSSTSCPADSVAASGTTCRASAGICDVAETCDGSSTSCSSDFFVASGITCRASGGVCDVAETCTGAAAACPADSFVAAGTSCRASTGACDAAETCSGAAAACPSDALFGSNYVCRAAADSCDIPEYCTLGTSSCPENKFNNSRSCQSAGVVCPRLNNLGGGAANYWCSPFNSSQYYMCQTGAWAIASVFNNCPAGTKCTCPYGVNCGTCGGPCTMPSMPPPVPGSC